MKTRSLFSMLIISLVMLAVLSPPAAQAQISVNSKVKDLQPSGRTVEFQAVVLTTTAYTSNPFSLSGYIGESLVTYPISVVYSLDTSNVNAGTEVDSVKAILFGYNLSTDEPVAVDTLSATLGTTTNTYTTLDLNNRKLAYYYWVVTGLGSNTAALFKATLFAYRRD